MMYREKNLIEDSFQAFLVDKARFTDNEEYPILTREMISMDIPNRILPFDKAINYHGDLSDTFICFYERDCTFERIRKNPKKYLSFLKKQQV